MAQGTRDLVAAAEAGGARRLVLMSALGTTEQNRDLVPYFRAKWDMEQAALASSLEHVHLPAQLRLRIRRRRATDVRPPGALVARDAGRRPGHGPHPADLGRRRGGVLRGERQRPGSGRADVRARRAGRGHLDELFERIRKVLGKRRSTVHLPVGLMRVGATLTDWLPFAPITRDQLKMLVEGGDQVCDPTTAIETLGVTPIGLDEQVRRAA